MKFHYVITLFRAKSTFFLVYLPEDSLLVSRVNHFFANHSNWGARDFKSLFYSLLKALLDLSYWNL